MLIFVFLALFWPLAQSCPSVCTCTGTTVDCQQQSLTALPSPVPAATETLLLQGSSFTTLPADMFALVPNLRVLRLDSSGITSVDPAAFNGLTALTELSLASNTIQTLPANIFSPFASTILQLNLAGNGITTISSSNVFSGMTALTSLDLSSNQLSSLPDNVFADLSAVTTFSLESNVITSIRTNSLNGLSGLITLNLQSNVINDIEAGSFSSLTATQVINLNGNQLTTFVDGVFSNLANLEEISLQDNRIDTLATTTFTDLPQLTKINLRGNRLSSGYDAFGSVPSLVNLDLSLNLFTLLSSSVLLPNLRTLDLSENQITTIAAFPFAGLSAVQEIYLQQNEISAIGGAVLGGMPLLQLVDLSYNNLIDVPSDSFTGLFGNTVAQTLKLNNNQIQSIPANAFVNCLSIQTIHLEHNSISTLNAESFANLPQLRVIYLSHNSLTIIPSRAFTTLARLETIYLNENVLEQVDSTAFEDLAVISSLNLSSNVIHTIQSGAFVNTPQLVSLYLNINRLTTTPKQALADLSSLELLDISSNLIASLSEAKFFGDLASLSTLIAKDNMISNMVADALGGMPGLVSVDLSGNQLTDVSSAFITSSTVPSLTTFNLKSNQLTNIAENAFIGFTSLETLDLTNNSLTSIPDGLLEMARSTLTNLIMEGNMWRCDCDLRWVQLNFSSAVTGGVCSTPPSEKDNTLGSSGTWIPGSCEETTTMATTTTPTTTQTTTTAPTTTSASGTQSSDTTTSSTAGVVIPLGITTAPYSVVVDASQTLSLYCNAVGSLQPTITWTSPNGSLISTGQQYNFDQSTGTLLITGITSDFGGVYICFANNSAGDQASIDVTVVVRFPPIIVRFFEVAVMPDSTSTLLCEVRAFPLADIYWATPSDGIINFNSTGSLIVTSSGTLHMTQRTPPDSGNYTCFASNELGSDNKTGYLFLYDSTQTHTVTMEGVNVGEEVLLTCGESITSGYPSFAWELPSGFSILYSPNSGLEEERLTYISDSSTVTTQGDGSSLSVELDQKYSVNTTTGSLTINNFSTSAFSPTDAITSQEGSYSCRTARGVYNYDVRSLTVVVSTNATNTTVIPLENGEVSPGVGTYYIVLGSLLLAAMFVLIFFLLGIYRRRNKEEEEDISRMNLIDMK